MTWVPIGKALREWAERNEVIEHGLDPADLEIAAQEATEHGHGHVFFELRRRSEFHAWLNWRSWKLGIEWGRWEFGWRTYLDLQLGPLTLTYHWFSTPRLPAYDAEPPAEP